MHLLTPRTKRSHAALVAVVVLVALSFVVSVPFALSANQQHAIDGASAPQASPGYPVAPAGPQGPIRLTCLPGHTGVIASDGPAGPQGPVGVRCASGPATAG